MTRWMARSGAAAVACLALCLGACVKRPCSRAQPATYAAVSVCGVIPIFVWTGHGCELAPVTPGFCGSGCTGPNCRDHFQSKDECEAAYLHCAP